MLSLGTLGAQLYHAVNRSLNHLEHVVCYEPSRQQQGC
jgi:hypothetical protein